MKGRTMSDNEETMMLKPTDAYEYLVAAKGYDKSIVRFRQLVQEGAFPNMQTIKRGRVLRHAIPVSDLDDFNEDEHKQKVGRRADPDAKYHGWRERYPSREKPTSSPDDELGEINGNI